LPYFFLVTFGRICSFWIKNQTTITLTSHAKQLRNAPVLPE
jgi:hypothetical protein